MAKTNSPESDLSRYNCMGHAVGDNCLSFNNGIEKSTLGIGNLLWLTISFQYLISKFLVSNNKPPVADIEAGSDILKQRWRKKLNSFFTRETKESVVSLMQGFMKPKSRCTHRLMFQRVWKPLNRAGRNFEKFRLSHPRKKLQSFR